VIDSLLWLLHFRIRFFFKARKYAKIRKKRKNTQKTQNNVELKKACEWEQKKSQHWIREQGDQIGRIFDHWSVVFAPGKFVEKLQNQPKHFGLFLFSPPVEAMRQFWQLRLGPHFGRFCFHRRIWSPCAGNAETRPILHTQLFGSQNDRVLRVGRPTGSKKKTIFIDLTIFFLFLIFSWTKHLVQLGNFLVRSLHKLRDCLNIFNMRTYVNSR
jgi:hypothetical protein